MKSYVFALLFSSLTIISLAQIPESASIDRIFEEWNQPDSPGGALGIIRDGELIYARGYGMANLEYAIPNSPTSVFRIGSTSKQFTAACIVLLAEQGKLSFDDKLSKFFPEFPDYADNINISQLLNHSSGIRDYLTIALLAGQRNDDYYTDEDVMRWLINQRENNFAPNEEFLYSNSGYWLLGQIVKQVSGESMTEFARTNLFEPLGMKNTHFHNDHNQIVINRASGYTPDDSGYSISMTTLDMIGDGGIFTTIEDMKIWDDNYYASSVLSKNFWPIMTAPLVLNNGDKRGYAKGISNGKYNGLTTLSHGGAFVGFRAEMIRFPEQKFSVVILANRSDGRPTPKAYQVADIFLKDKFIIEKEATEKKKNASEPTTPSKEKEIDLREIKVEEYSGNYYSKELDVVYTLYVDDGILKVQVKNRKPIDLSVVDIDKFNFRYIKFRFSRNNGLVSGFQLDAGRVKNLIFEKK